MTTYSRIWNKLRDKKYRDAFVNAQLKRSIPFQISALRKRLKLSQEELAKAAQVTQGVISRAENPNYGNLTLNTILRIANGCDVAVHLEFISFRKLIEDYENRSEDAAPLSFEKEELADQQEERKKKDTRTDYAAKLAELNLESLAAKSLAAFQVKPAQLAAATTTASGSSRGLAVGAAQQAKPKNPDDLLTHATIEKMVGTKAS